MAGLNIAKCTLVLGQGQTGWTENYFLDNPTPTLDAEVAKLYALAAKRILMSGAQTYISALKVSNESILRDAVTAFYGTLPATPFKGSTSHDSDFPDTAVLFKRNTDTRVSISNLFVRGIWDDLITLGGTFVPSPDWIAVYNAYRAQLLADAWGFVGKDPTTLARQNITNVVQAASGQITITAANAIFAGGMAGQKAKVFISGVQGAASVNGPQVVTVTNVTTCQTVKRIPMFAWTAGGLITPTTPKFFLISKSYYSRAVERKVGRPLFLSRGRSKARALA